MQYDIMDRRSYLRTLGGASVLGVGSGVASAGGHGKVGERVVTESGPVEGVYDDGVFAYKGIPYAKQPVGDRRFRPPQTPAPSWDEPLDGSEWGPRAPQPLLLSEFSGIGGTRFVGREDGCLNLNVWTPRGTDEGEKPVMFWIHGGAYNFRSNRFPGQALADFGDVVVVATNYRLNALGFFAHPELTVAQPSAPTNFGYLDIRAALEWVQRNVAAFGGDPNDVTIFGESAGGHAVLTLMTDSDASGLFHRAISESGLINAPLFPLAQLEQRGANASGKLDCSGADTLLCLRDATPLELAKAYGATSGLAGGQPPDGLPGVVAPQLIFGVDGQVVEEHPAVRFANGQFHDAPLLLGSNADGYQFFVALPGSEAPTSAAEYRALIDQRYGQFADRIGQYYPPEQYDSIEAAFVDLITHETFLCSDYRVGRNVTEHGGTAYRYVFDDTPTIPTTALFVSDPGAYHTAELSYVWGDTVTQQGLPTGILGPSDYKLRYWVQSYWTNFAKRGDPNGRGWFAPPKWPAVDDQETRVRLQAHDVPVERGTEPGCEAFVDVYEYVHSQGY
ncbi:MAG: carboxylesterase/lipase family protein [Haloarculaceae archaeon]